MVRGETFLNAQPAVLMRLYAPRGWTPQSGLLPNDSDWNPFFLSILCVNKDFCFLTLQPCILQPDLVNLNTAVPWKNRLDVGAYRLPTDDRLSINNLVSAQ